MIPLVFLVTLDVFQLCLSLRMILSLDLIHPALAPCVSVPLAQTSCQAFLLCLPLSSTCWGSVTSPVLLCVFVSCGLSSTRLAPGTINPLRILKSRSSPVVRMHLSTTSWMYQRLLKLSTPSVELFAPRPKFASPPSPHQLPKVAMLWTSSISELSDFFLKGRQ